MHIECIYKNIYIDYIDIKHCFHLFGSIINDQLRYHIACVWPKIQPKAQIKIRPRHNNGLLLNHDIQLTFLIGAA